MVCITSSVSGGIPDQQLGDRTNSLGARLWEAQAWGGRETETWSHGALFDPFSLRLLGLEVSAAMADRAPIGLGLVSPVTGAILSINQTAALALGVAPSAMIGRRVGRVLARPHDRRWLTARLGREGRLDGAMVWLRRDTGQLFQALIWLKPVTIHGQVLLAVALIELADSGPLKNADTLTRPTAGGSRFSLAAAIAAALRMQEPELIRRRLMVDIECPGAIAIEGRRDVLVEVLTLLTRNTLAHAFPSRHGGRLRIVGRLASNGVVEVRHEDDGFGISPEYLPRVFEPFFTTAYSRGASGIGLTIVRTLVVERMGGRVELESRLGRGTTAVLRLQVSRLRQPI